MAKKNIPGQMSFTFDLSTDTRNYVVQSNDLILAKQSLKLNSARIIRGIIMQIQYDDDDFKTYHISCTKLQELTGIPRVHLYRDIRNIVKDIQDNGVSFAPKDNNKKAFVNLPWCDAVGYDDEIGLLIKINPLLKPYLLNLKTAYAQYQLEDILQIKSIYGLRLYELLLAKVNGSLATKNARKITIKIDDLKRSLNCENKYERISQFKEKVLNVAIRSIMEYVPIHISYKIVKDGHKSDEVEFTVQSLIYARYKTEKD